MASELMVAKVMSLLSVYFPEREMTTELVEAYYIALVDLTDEQLEQAAAQAVRTLKWHPKVAELREIAAEQTAHGAGVTTAAEAIEQIYRVIREIGSYGNPHFDDPLLNRVIAAMGGWRELCLSENVMADRAHMIKLYSEIATAARKEIQVGMFGGYPPLIDTGEQIRLLARRMSGCWEVGDGTES